MNDAIRTESAPGSNTAGPATAVMVPQRMARQKLVDRVLAAVRGVYATVTPDDREAVMRLLVPRTDGASARIDVTPAMAAILVTERNGSNRPLEDVLAKIGEYARMMDEGLWRAHHQGFGFDAAGKMIDGQTRCHAAAMTGTTIPRVVITHGLTLEEIDTADNGGLRKAHQSLAMRGTSNGQANAKVAKMAKRCLSERHGAPITPTEIEVARFATQHSERIAKALELARRATDPIAKAERKLPIVTAAVVAFVCLTDGVPDQKVLEGLTLLQAGNADSEGSPLYKAALLLDKSREARSAPGRLSEKQCVVVSLRGIKYWLEGIAAVQMSKMRAARKDPIPTMSPDA